MNKINEKSKEIFEARNYFFDCIDWVKVVKTVEDIVVTNLKRIEDKKIDSSSKINFYERLT